MKPVAKFAIVAAGYVIAVGVAMLVLRAYVAGTSGPDRQTYGTMFAFGDDLLFLGTLALTAIPATGAALYFLRPRRAFWTVLATISLVVAFTALVAVALIVGPKSGGGWSAIAPLRIFVAPVFAIFFLLCGLFAPSSSARKYLLGATAIEIVAFVCGVLTWWNSSR